MEFNEKYIDDISTMTEEQLISEIEKHNNLYWLDGTPEISDEVYDLLIRRLEELNPEHSILEKLQSPKVTSSGSIELDEPMMSLYKTYHFKIAPKGKKSLIDWINDNSRSEKEVYLIQPKYDGISTYFFNDTLVTKGRRDIEGENISDKIPIIKLQAVNYSGLLSGYNCSFGSIRGEIIISDDEFDYLKENLYKVDGNTYKSSRNAVSGILNLKNIREVVDKKIFLTLIDYNLYSWTVRHSEFEDRWNSIVTEIDKLCYPVDGVVIKIADQEYSKSLGNTAHHPRGQLAFKFTGKTKKSKLIDVEWSFGKGRLTPVGKIEPVEINGVIISNITLHNINIVEENDIKIGDTLTIERAGDVIPHVIKSEAGRYRRSFMIERCPFCNGEVVRDNKIIKCINLNCFETNLQKSLYSIRALGIKGIGENNLRKIMLTLGLADFTGIFNISRADLLRVDNFKDKMADNIYNSIWENKTLEDYKILACLDINGIGENIAKKILYDYTINELMNMSQNRLSAITDIGPELSKNLYVGLRDKKSKIEFLNESFAVVSTRSSVQSKRLFYVDVDIKYDKIKMCVDRLLSINYVQVKSIRDEDGNIYIPDDLDTVITYNRDKMIRKYNLSSDVRILSPEDCLSEFDSSNTQKNKNTICFTGKFNREKEFYKKIAIERGYTTVDFVTRDLRLLVTSSVDLRSNKVLKAEMLGIKIVYIGEWL